MSQITSHVLDTTRGLPASNLPITLYVKKTEDNNETSLFWHELASGLTNNDGRVANLLADDITLPAGIYRMHFKTSTYFEQKNEKGFYPFVDIVFELDDSDNHYHIPLLLTAYGYSTYRGS